MRMYRIGILLGFMMALLPSVKAQGSVPSNDPKAVLLGYLGKEVEGTSTLFFLDGRLWTCNDHGRLRLYALDTLTGRVDSTVDLKVNVYDLEEVTQDDSYLYFGDFGDNRGVRKDLRILCLAKEDFRRGNYRFDTIAFSYPDRASGTLARNFDCEAFVSVGDSLYLFTKQWISQGSVVYALLKTPGRHKARRSFTLDTRGLVTAACYLGDSHHLVLLGYTVILYPFVYIVEDFEGWSTGDVRRVQLDISLGTQTEGIASLDGRTFFISNETFQKAFLSFKASLQKVDLRGYLSER